MKKNFGSQRPRAYLKKGKAKPFWHHHPWVYSGAIKNVKGKPQDGDIIAVFDDAGDFVGKGFYNSKSQIRVRLLSWDLHEKIHNEFFHRKIKQALYLRETILMMRTKSNAYRLINSEGDGLPGLTVDRYKNYLCVQFLSLGMELHRDIIIKILKQETKINNIVERYSAGYRKREGLEEIDFRYEGDEPKEDLQIKEYELKFYTSLQKGQKTGFYIDQRENRHRLTKYAYNKKILDAFCYTGSFGIYMLTKGKAAEVVFLDSSSYALELLKKNLELNDCSKNAKIKKADIFKDLKGMQEAGETFDMIILDPPKVAPDKSSLYQGTLSLKNLNMIATKMLNPSGILVSCDCSGLITPNEFRKTVNKAVIEAGKTIRIFENWGAGPDHPVNPSCLENSYLKVIVGMID